MCESETYLEKVVISYQIKKVSLKLRQSKSVGVDIALPINFLMRVVNFQ